MWGRHLKESERGVAMNRKGFTLIEILLVVVIMGIMLAVIVPRAWRANIDAKYATCRQNATEIAKYGMSWAEGELMTQDSDSTATLADYIGYLSGRGQASNYGTTGTIARWIADSATARNWQVSTGTVVGRLAASASNALSGPCVNTVPKDKPLINPFNGVEVFLAPNQPTGGSGGIAGAMCSGMVQEAAGSNWYYSAIVFQGTESVAGGNNVTAWADMHGNMDALTLAGLRNGVMMARVQD